MCRFRGRTLSWHTSIMKPLKNMGCYQSISFCLIFFGKKSFIKSMFPWLNYTSVECPIPPWILQEKTTVIFIHKPMVSKSHISLYEVPSQTTPVSDCHGFFNLERFFQIAAFGLMCWISSQIPYEIHQNCPDSGGFPRVLLHFFFLEGGVGFGFFTI